METKKVFHWFSIFEHEKEEAWLREQHKAGWDFIRVSGFGTYHFARCEPMDMVYQLDYNDAARKDREGYLGMFRDCGWEYLQDYAGYCYFRKSASEMQGEERIFSDMDSKRAMMGRAFRGRLLPLLPIFFCIVLPQFTQQVSNGRVGLSIFYGFLFGLYLALFLGCGIYWLWLKKK